MASKIYLGNDHQIVRDMAAWNTTTGVQTPQSGLVLTGFLSATMDGAAIHASLSATLAEVGGTARYYTTLTGANLTTHLASYVGKTIYERVTGAGYSDYTPVRVVAARPVDL